MVMRTTLTLSNDALELARRLARRKRVSLGEAVSELVRRGAQLPVPTMERQGLTVVRLPRGSARVTAAAVEELLEDLP
jgi:hypothetical protein